MEGPKPLKANGIGTASNSELLRIQVVVEYLLLCFFLLFVWFPVGSIVHIQNLQKSQGWRELRRYPRSFFWCIFMAFGLLVFGHSVCRIRRSDPARLPGCVPCQFKLWASRLYGFALLVARCFLKQDCADQNKAGGGGGVGLKRSYTRYLLHLIRPIANGRIAFLRVRLWLKLGGRGGAALPPSANAMPGH